VKTKTLILTAITTSLALSLLTTLATYNVISHSDQRILDAAWIDRGWPLYWMKESWSYWSPPPYTIHFTFEPANFLIDFIFYAITFQIPMQIYIYLKEARKSKARSNANAH